MNQPRFPGIFRIESIWFWHEQELEPIAQQLAARLGLVDLTRDYEDTWEWVILAVETVHRSISVGCRSRSRAFESSGVDVSVGLLGEEALLDLMPFLCKEL